MAYHPQYVLILTLCIQGWHGVATYDLKGRIVKGYRVEINQFPHSAFLHFKKTVPTGCGGSVISANAIISAAHCFEELRYRHGSITVFLGSTVPINSQAVRHVNGYRIHPRFDPKTGKFNLGLAYIYSAIPLGRYIQKIPIATKAPTTTAFLYTSGWGKQVPNRFPDYSEMRYLKASKQRVIGPHKCQKFTGHRMSSVHWCTVSFNGYHYQGDAGNGLVSEDHFLIGVVSHMINEATIYSDVIRQQPWILKAVKTMAHEYCSYAINGLRL